MAAADDDRVVASFVGHRSGRPSAARAEHLQRRDPPVGAHDPAARVGRRAAQPEVADRRPEARLAGHRPVEEELLERQLALEDVALGQARRPLDVERRLDLAVEDDVADVRRELGDPVDDRVAERLALVVPGPELGASLYGAYWTKQLMTCLPGGAIDGSTSVGMIMSMYGRRLKRPYLASS